MGVFRAEVGCERLGCALPTYSSLSLATYLEGYHPDVPSLLTKHAMLTIREVSVIELRTNTTIQNVNAKAFSPNYYLTCAQQVHSDFIYDYCSFSEDHNFRGVAAKLWLKLESYLGKSDARWVSQSKLLCRDFKQLQLQELRAKQRQSSQPPCPCPCPRLHQPLQPHQHFASLRTSS
jgi:hypothetical protein